MTALRIPRAAILTWSGIYFDLEKPDPALVRIEDVAHALSNLCRFTGHAESFYSVAEHSVLCSRIVPPEFALEALLHDAPEAYVGDVSFPLKSLLPQYREIEARVAAAVLPALGVRALPSPEVKAADLAMLRLEQLHRCVMGNLDEWGLLDGVQVPDGVTISCWTPLEARYEFMRRYGELRFGAAA